MKCAIALTSFLVALSSADARVGIGRPQLQAKVSAACKTDPQGDCCLYGGCYGQRQLAWAPPTLPGFDWSGNRQLAWAPPTLPGFDWSGNRQLAWAPPTLPGFDWSGNRQLAWAPSGITLPPSPPSM